ncbi:MAG: BMC domain-containing protein [Lachnospiraceae bacterium]|nr:BMC domain-containing protein [Lachnospiraceae bacterium]
MSRQMTREEFLREIFQDYDTRGNTEPLRLVRVRVPSCEVSLAHLIGVSQTEVYQTLGLHIGVHEGEDHTGETLGFLKFTPWEATVVAADIAIKSGAVEIGFLDRFCGALILTGGHSEVRSAIEGVIAFFRDELHFPVCPITES